MTCAEAMDQLRSWGNEKMRDVNMRHGAGENHFGVNLSQVRGLAKEIKRNHPLALELWATGNVDARLLATQIMTPKALSEEDLDRMVRELGYFKVTDWFVENVVKPHPAREKLRPTWAADPDEQVGRAGWSLTTHRIVKEAGKDIDPTALLDTIEAEMKQAAEMKQWSMNHCLAEIGFRYPELRERAIAIAEKLEVLKDYPVSKGCTSPFAPHWIAYLVEHSTK